MKNKAHACNIGTLTSKIYCIDFKKNNIYNK